MKFLIVSRRFDTSIFDGMTRYIEYLVSELCKRGHQITMICGPLADSVQTENRNQHLNVNIIRHNIVEELKYYPHKWRSLRRKVNYILQKEQPDCIILQHPYHAPAVISAAKTGNYPTIYICHTVSAVDAPLRGGDLFFESNSENLQLEQYAITNADAVICVSQTMKKLINRLYNAPFKKLHYVPTGIPPFPLSRQGPLTRKLRKIKSKGMRIILYSGRESWEKGTDLLPEIIRQVTSKIDSVYFVLIGIYREKWSNYLLLPRTILLPWLNDQELAYTYQKSDILLLPSRRDSMPYVLLEAMLNSISPVVTDFDGPGELITHNLNGIKIKPRFTNGKIYIQPESFSSSLISILDEDNELERMKKNAYELIAQKFTINNQISKFLSTVKSVIG